MLTHHKLKVYQKSLALGAGAGALTASRGRRHAIVQHFCRATDSIVFNIAGAGRLSPGSDNAKTLDYAIGSALLSRIIALVTKF